jgi:hypothetical protein
MIGLKVVVKSAIGIGIVILLLAVSCPYEIPDDSLLACPETDR